MIGVVAGPVRGGPVDGRTAGPAPTVGWPRTSGRIIVHGCLPVLLGNLYAGLTFASAIRPFGPAGGTSWFDTFDQPVPGVGGRCVQDLFQESHLPTSLISLAGGSFPPANEDMLKRGSR